MDFFFYLKQTIPSSLNIFIKYNKMPRQLPTDCLNGIFKYLEQDKVALRSCLLVDSLWCEVSVQILWTNIQNFNTLIACLPDESKEILQKNEIIISTPTSTPLFNYVTFIKSLSVNEICKKINNSQNFDKNKNIIVTQEIFKMFMNQISLKTLDFYYLYYSSYIQNI